jgi:hypothetical protein
MGLVVVASRVRGMVGVGSGGVRWGDVNWNGVLCFVVSRVGVVVSGWWKDGGDVSEGFRGRLMLECWMDVGKIVVCGNAGPPKRWDSGCKKAEKVVCRKFCFVGRSLGSGRNSRRSLKVWMGDEVLGAWELSVMWELVGNSGESWMGEEVIGLWGQLFTWELV